MGLRRAGEGTPPSTRRRAALWRRWVAEPRARGLQRVTGACRTQPLSTWEAWMPWRCQGWRLMSPHTSWQQV